MKNRPHTHPCALSEKGCTNQVECSGALRRNHDGFPEVVCDQFHTPNGFTDPQACAACEADTCVLCGRVVKFEGHTETCSQNPDNYDGEDLTAPDAWEGGFARTH